MALSRKVKISDLSNLSAGRLAAGFGVEFIGLSLAKLMDESQQTELLSISAWLSGPRLVLEWGKETPSQDFVSELQKVFSFSHFQVPYGVSLGSRTLPLIHHLPFRGVLREVEDALASVKDSEELVLVSLTKYKLGELKQALAHLETSADLSKVLLSAPFSLEDLESLCEQFPRLGFDFPSPSEAQPGALTDDFLTQCLELLEED